MEDDVIDRMEAEELDQDYAWDRWLYRHRHQLSGYRPMPAGRTGIANRGTPARRTHDNYLAS